MSVSPPIEIESTEPVARARAARIREGIHHYLETLAEIALAWERRDWAVLGYADWAAYVDGEFGAARLKLPIAHRQKAVQELRLTGMSQRAIGTALGVDQATVKRDLDSAGDAFASPAEITGADGKTHPATRPAAATPAAEPAGPGPDERVWVATARKGIAAHALRSSLLTRCSRATRTGLTLTARQAADRWETTWCRTCWPTETTRDAAGDAALPGPPDTADDLPAGSQAGAEIPSSAPATDPLAGVGDDYEPDPARRIAAVAEVAPEYVRPAERPTETATGTHLTSSPVDGADVDPAGVDTGDPATPHVEHAAPALAPPSATSPANGGAGVTPTKPQLTLPQIARLRAAVRHLLATGTRTAPGCYEVPYSSASPALSGPQPVTEAGVQWWPDGEIHVRFTKLRGAYCTASTEFYAGSVDQGVDIMCALGILPAHLSTQHAAGAQAGMRAGDAIDGQLTEENNRG